ncbi:hypothetical protein ACGYTQ_10285 [Burkholderia pseudomallei]|uniref:hypothetical protein n=1 Tax=Burkholderia pseudomallei TaxID=28450 RepID=UPI00039ED2AB|nr:hypothetical protein [Burkholderia pseudomallei]MBF3451133.1 hypothetical protein [Burkholderia pseudomallei]MBF3475508.1 hypothetical protein [Burkholderia pseudomallei]MBF3511195.1 hypothetical protein [Burkholderia pseudomallei]MBF3513828.1 hypothetical protein [Burkholderia pseudomallei]MBF3584992.1 hypothetical protein [Burkholderia pseudomallei]
MGNSTVQLDQISSTQANKEVTANALFDAASPATLWGRRASTTSGLTWGYYGGNFVDNTGTNHAITNGTLTLTASTTNYVYADNVTGAVSVNTTGFPAGKVPLYSIVTNASQATSYLDYRSYQPSITGGSIQTIANEGSGVGIYDTVTSGQAKFKSLVAGSGVTVTDNGNGTVTIGTSGSSGTVTGGSNEGSGVGVFDATNSTSTTLKYKSLVQGANVTLTDGGTSGITVATSSSVSGSPNVQQQGSTVVSAASVLNLQGPTVTGSGSTATVTLYPSTGSNDVAPPLASSLTWRNQGSTTVTQNNWGFTVKAPSNGSTSSRISGLTAAIPSAPYQFAARIGIQTLLGNYLSAGLFMLDSSSGKIKIFCQTYNGGSSYLVGNCNSYTSFNSSVLGITPMPIAPDWMRIRDDNTNWYYEVSCDGVTWITMAQEARNSFVTPNAIGVYVDAANATYGLMLSVHSWYLGT